MLWSQWKADGRATSSCLPRSSCTWCHGAKMKNTTSSLKWEQREWQKHILFEKGFRCLFFSCHIWEVLIKKDGCLKSGQDKESQAITCFSSNRLAEEGLFWHTEKYLKGSSEMIRLSVCGGRGVVLSDHPVFFMSGIVLLWYVWGFVCE